MFVISSNLTLTKGYKKSILGNFKNNELFHIENNQAVEIHRLIKKRFLKKEDVTPGLFDFLIENRMVYKIPENIKNNFPEKKLQYASKYHIEFLIYKYSTSLGIDKVIDICEKICIPNLVIHLNNNIINQIEEKIKDKSFPESVTIVTNNKEMLLEKNRFRILITQKDNRPFVHRDSVDFNYQLFVESHFHHNYFNKKIYIGNKGEIKNTPESVDVFANLTDLNLIQKLNGIISSNKFQKLWNVHKGICDVCKDCEFKYMCVDNRVPEQRNEKEWFHSTECNYNPYIGKWKEEKEYVSLKQLGVVSNSLEFSLNFTEN
ncbi:hypothetical protein [Tenacibaculum halocynthiae]|uniref:hypothetical protein n=1 Tax=Tenacibaculum halocynthiae TaxID=1254437 RepID=UPI003D657FE3